MSAVVEAGTNQSPRAKARGAGFYALAVRTVAVHLAALTVLFTTEY